MRRFLWICTLGFLLALSWVAAASAQQPTPSDDEVNAIARQLYCPVCENTPLDVCPTQACAQWRDLIREKLADGWTQAQIKQYFADQYGARVLSEPPREGLYWLVYVVPPVALLIGAYILVRALRSWRKSTASGGLPGPDAESAPGSEDEYVARLEAELRERK